MYFYLNTIDKPLSLYFVIKNASLNHVIQIVIVCMDVNFGTTVVFIDQSQHQIHKRSYTKLVITSNIKKKIEIGYSLIFLKFFSKAREISNKK